MYEFYPENLENGSVDSKKFNGYIAVWDLKKGFVRSAKFINNIIIENGTVKALTSEQLMLRSATSKSDSRALDSEDGMMNGSSPTPTPLREIVIDNSYKDPFVSVYFPTGGDNSGFNIIDYTSSYGGGSSGGSGNGSTTAAANTIQKQINTEKLPPCLKKILDDLIKINAGPGNMILKFAGDQSTGYNWTMLQGANNLGVSGNTLSTYDRTSGITTTFDIVQYPNATELGWAKTMLHESIHAYLTTYYKLKAPSYIADYPVLFQDWCANGNKDLNKYQHEEIARNLVKSLGEALESYGISKGYNLSKQFYQDMAWGGY